MESSAIAIYVQVMAVLAMVSWLLPILRGPTSSVSETTGRRTIESIAIVRKLLPWLSEQNERAEQYDVHLQMHSVQIDSPFELIWSDCRLPPWAKKSVNYDIPPDDRVCFVHVGKAGGSSIGCSLGFSLHCKGSHEQEGLLPAVATHLFHKDVYNCHDDSAYYLFVVRDPIERARSAFNYDRPDTDSDDDDANGEFYFDCPFFHFEDFVQSGLVENGEASESCKRMARKSLRGDLLRGPSHFYYNYQYYYEAVPKNSSILVIRNEHMQEDWNHIEAMLGGKGEVSIPRSNANTWSSEEDLYLSQKSIEVLCQALCNEIKTYKSILKQAQNIDDEQLLVSLSELKSRCPVEAAVDECSEPMPDISVKLQENRGYNTIGEDAS